MEMGIISIFVQQTIVFSDAVQIPMKPGLAKSHPEMLITCSTCKHPESWSEKGRPLMKHINVLGRISVNLNC